MKTKLFLSALGIASSLGFSKKEVFDNLLKGSLKNVIWRDNIIADKKVKLATVINELPEIPEQFKFCNTRCNRLLLASYLQIKDEVQEMIKKYGKDRIAVIIGSSTSGIEESQSGIESYLKNGKYPNDFDYTLLEMGSPAKFLANFLGLEGIFYTVSTACSSGAKAFVSARNMINLNLCDAVLVGGSDSLCQLTVAGFNALESVSDNICNPFSVNRNGITLGEGSALFLLSKEVSEIELLGVGESSDAYHTTSPDLEGKGAVIAIEAALKEADLKCEDIDYINLHGTGTKLNDQMESMVVNNLFGDKVYCSSTKPLTGHTLGSSGIIEIGLCWLLLQKFNENKNLPPHIWDGEFDLNLPKLNLVKMNDKADKLSICLSNSFAFGGSNASVIIGKNV